VAATALTGAARTRASIIERIARLSVHIEI
jgi:hypothetical protein